jgi:N-acetylglucosamine malate deacetylase 2
MPQRDAGAALLATLCAPGDSAPPAPATAVVVAHPDDETVGAGGRLERLGDAHFVCVTTGATRSGGDAARRGLAPQAFAALRRQELERLFALCGIDRARLGALEIADQEASLHLAGIARQLARHFAAHGIQAVLTHPYEGGHPDHDATAFAVRAAVALLRQQGAHAPAIVEMSSYHLGPHGLQAGTFLPAPAQPLAHPVTVPLTPAQQARKRERLACFESQRETLAQFGVAHECFRAAPPCDFARPPHEGALFYERFPWGMTAARFNALCGQAQRELGLEGAL